MATWVVSLLNFLIRGLGAVVTAIFGLLPDSPFQTIFYSNTVLSQYLGYINYFIPVSVFITILQGWLTGIALYYVYQIVLRWVKSIE